MSYTHFTITERSKIEVYLELKMSIRTIAKKLNRSPSSVSRECQRNPNYQAEKAQTSYNQRKAACGAHSKLTASLKIVIQEKLDQTWSLEQISGRLLQGSLTFKTIYRWIYAGLLDVPLTVLRQKGKRQKPKETRGRFVVGTPISKRPKEIRKRTTFGHWELDTVVSGRGQAKGCVATFVERQTRWYKAILIPDRSAKSMERAIRTLHALYPREAFQSFTTDRGKEFACYTVIESELNIPMYFADAYAAWQRGSNENSNGLFREFFPKRTNFDTILTEEVEEALSLINNRPRKCLDWKTPYEAFMEKVLHLI
ncbi:transposase, IS30 family [Carnobacterium alterfunditum]|uniref:Transposase, IS30 family n=1 Tax=Carnobacterium alterfunditum TaxID=28230 RepID=A0A1N6FTL3_9LACT|nr:IS30 family transposase [Carnobacterium alterfunditum]SIN98562.1 transposase, IS30 family [Carnobacterium alterfunditum]